MLTPHLIRRRAEKWYQTHCSSWLAGKPYQPLILPVGALPHECASYQASLKQLCNGAKDRSGVGYIIHTRIINKRLHGKQTIPITIEFQTRRDLLQYINRDEEFARLQEDATTICHTLPALEPWVLRWPHKVIANHVHWPILLMICQFFLEHPLPAVQMRDIPLPCSTKFIERHQKILRSLLDAILPAEAIVASASSFEQRYGLLVDDAEVSCRFLDQAVQQQVGSPFKKCTLPLPSLAHLPITRGRVIVLESKRSFLSLPDLPQTTAFWGSGFQAATLHHIPWLATCHLYYWGDLDAQGFEILSSFRSHFPHTQALCMDTNTYIDFAHFSIPGEPAHLKTLPGLTPAEYELYTYLQYHTLRLEQERIPIAYALKHLHALSPECSHKETGT